MSNECERSILLLLGRLDVHSFLWRSRHLSSGQEHARRAALSVAGVSVSGFVHIGLTSALPSVPILSSAGKAPLQNAVELTRVNEDRRLVKRLWGKLQLAARGGHPAEQHRVHLAWLKHGGGEGREPHEGEEGRFDREGRQRTLIRRGTAAVAAVGGAALAEVTPALHFLS